MFLLYLYSIFLFSGEAHRLYIHPLDFEDESKPESLYYGISRIDTNGKELFILLTQEPGVIQVQADGTFIRRIGRGGNGPGELGDFACSAMAVEGQSVWLLNASRTHLFYFESGVFRNSFKNESYQFHRHTVPANFTFNQDVVLLQVFPGSKKLAAVYNFGGERLRYVGDILLVEPEYLKINQSLNNTTWDQHQEKWFCMFMYQPIIRVFSREFKLIKELTPQGPEIDEYNEKYFQKKKDPNFDTPWPHVTDFKIFKGHGYFLSNAVLYQIDLETGETLHRVSFYGKGYEFEKYGETPMDRLHFYSFAILDSGVVVLANIDEVCGHDLWQVKLPFIQAP